MADPVRRRAAQLGERVRAEPHGTLAADDEIDKYLVGVNVIGAQVDPADYDSDRKQVATESGPVGYLDVGSGRPALFVHGVGTGGLLWRNVIGMLRAERRCIAVDLPLHGRTPARPDQDLSLTALAKAVEDFCAALDLTGGDWWPTTPAARWRRSWRRTSRTGWPPSH